VRNAGGGTLDWSAVVIPVDNFVTVFPSGDVLGAGRAETVTVTGTPSENSFAVQFNSQEDGSQTVTFTCA
jgi:hypothetical protein